MALVTHPIMLSTRLALLVAIVLAASLTGSVRASDVDALEEAVAGVDPASAASTDDAGKQLPEAIGHGFTEPATSAEVDATFVGIDAAPADDEEASDELLLDAVGIDAKQIPDDMALDGARMQMDVTRYERAVERLEAQFGAYEAGISQQLMGLGLTYQNAGQHQQAISAFRRAIHIKRINEGLFNLSEVPILEEMIESHAALGEWEEVNDRYHFLFKVHNRSFGSADPRALPALEKLSNWHLQAYNQAFSDNPLNHLLAARNLFDSSIRIIAVNFGDRDRRLAEPLRKRTLVDYYLATYVPNGATAADMVTNVTSFADVDNDAAMAGFMVNSYSIGKRALGTIREIYGEDETASLQEQAAAIVDLADWHMLFNRRQSAFRTYNEAIALLDAHPEGEDLQQQFFGKPIALPAMSIFDIDGGLEQEPEPAPKPEGYLLLKFTVDEGGRVRDVELLESQPEDRDVLGRKVRRRLRATRFRPRFESGQPIETENVTYRYSF